MIRRVTRRTTCPVTASTWFSHRKGGNEYEETMEASASFPFAAAVGLRCAVLVFWAVFCAVTGTAGQRQSVYIGLPVYEQAGASLLCGLLYSGHRCFISQQPDIKLLKRKKVWAVVCDKLSVQLYEETVKCKVFAVDTDVSKKFVYAGGGILYPDCVSDDLSGLTGLHVSCKFDGKKIRIVTETNKTPDPSDELVKLISKRCNELLYGLDVPKSLVFVVKTV